MPTIPPTWILFVAAGATLGLYVASWLSRRRRERSLARLAAEMGVVCRLGADRELAGRLVPFLPIGAADVRVTNVLERSRGSGRIAVARVDYSLGSVGHRRNNTRLAQMLWTEDDGPPLRVRLLAPDDDWSAQYRSLVGA